MQAGADVVLRNGAGDEARLSTQGAQLLSWQPAGEGEQLYLSPLSRPAPGVAVRGGVPVCFPQFSERGPLPKHGFVRTQEWQLLVPPVPHAPIAEARFQLDSSMPGPWDRAFCVVLVARLGARWLELELQAANTGRTPWSFTAALHTYLQVGDVRAVRIAGLRGLDYEDMVGGNTLRSETEPVLAIADETDRVYREAARAIDVTEPGRPPRHVTQQGFRDAVVWNPGPAKATRLGDMPADDWPRMLCIEAGAIAQPVELAPGKTWSGIQRIALA
ncbi:D-hexose-6-phosphate mutarotase [Ramlibacter sp. USB13]|uniref:Putative glucose-6-phosphate 1-epimerase n=1 Tax=Ramlibacter cellulosilyticus TaxID=2764187 RepID=A0A923S9J1_9BURK|nr:D-hexose-6-phosphate mutarotase [Ramlibacter cellulosilyticus]MBC5781720.1 D-hexose-6-phosphate mutarotase [Ramlibacter cellulosilyticus]